MKIMLRISTAAIALLVAPFALATPYDSCGQFFTGIEGCTLFQPDGGGPPVLPNGPIAPYHIGDRARMQGDFDSECISFCGAPCINGITISACSPPCRADFNGSGTLTIDDVFAFINAWMSGQISADFDQSGTLAVADIFAFIQAWFTGC